MVLRNQQELEDDALSLTVLVVEKDDWGGAARAIVPLAKEDSPHKVTFLVVIDQNSHRGDEERLARDFELNGVADRIRVLRSPNAGLAAGWSFGASVCTTSHIVRLDAHGAVPVEFLSRSFLALSSYRNSEPPLIPGGPVGLRPSPEASGRLVPEVISAVECSALFSGGMGPHKKLLSEPTVADFSARALYPTSLIRQLGGFETMPFACEDTEFAGRVVQNGYRYILIPELLSWHYPRRRLLGFFSQKARNGGAIGYLFSTGSRSSVRKLLPLGGFAFGLACLLPRWRSRKRTVLLASIYSLMAGATAWPTLSGRPLRPLEKVAGVGLAPVVAFGGHCSYALGQIRGLAVGAFSVARRWSGSTHSASRHRL